MPRKGTLFITSKGRHFIRSLKLNEEQIRLSSDPFIFLGDNPEISASKMHQEDYAKVTFDEDTVRLSSHMLISILEEYRDEGPLEYDWDDSHNNKEIADWLIRHKYLAFVADDRSIFVQPDV